MKFVGLESDRRKTIDFIERESIFIAFQPFQIPQTIAKIVDVKNKDAMKMECLSLLNLLNY